MQTKILSAMLTLVAVATVLLPDQGRSESPLERDSLAWRPQFGLAFRSAQVDGYTLIIVSSLAGSCDIDLIELSPGRHATFGIRVGAEYLRISGFAGDRKDYYDVHWLLRFTAAGSVGRFDLAGGLTSRSSDRLRITGAGDQILMLFFEERLNLVSNWFGLFGKFTATLEPPVAGIGVFLTWDTGP